MNRIYYKKTNPRAGKNLLKLSGIFLSIIGLGILTYIFTPFVWYQFHLAEVFASQDITSPVPDTSIVSQTNRTNAVLGESDLEAIDYTNAKNWFPTYTRFREETKIQMYYLSVPRLRITKATVSTVDDDLGKHLVNYTGTATPPEKGTSVIFGHSTLPSLFNPKDYKTIFANAHDLQIGDKLIATVATKDYTYEIYSMTVVDPTDTSVFLQKYDNSYIAIVTCTPPGTILKRLIIKARLIGSNV